MEYKGRKITVTDELRFKVTGLDETFNDRESAEHAIDLLIKNEAELQRVKMNIPVLASPEEGKFEPRQSVITGMHAGHGKILTKPVIGGGYRRDELYPDVGWLDAALKQQAMLQNQVKRIDKVLSKFSIVSPHSTYHFDKGALVTYLAKLAKECASKKKTAESTNLSEELEKIPAVVKSGY